MMVKTPPARSIIEAIGSAAAAWSDSSFPSRLRARDAVVRRTGYCVPVVEHALDQLFRPMTSPAIAAIIADELGTVEVLDRFVERPARHRVRALPAGRVCIVSSRTTIGVSIVPAIFALCAKCDVLVKDREDRLVAAFFSTLSDMLPELGGRAHAGAWRGDADAVDLDRFDAIVAFGSDITLETIAAGLRFPTRLIAYPSKLSAGYVPRASLQTHAGAAEIARGAARDAILYDGEGCLCLHALFVERGGEVSAGQFCEILRDAIDVATREFPATPSARSGARVAMAREAAAFRTAIAGSAASDARSGYLVRLDDPPNEPPLLLPQALTVRSVDEPAEAVSYLQRHRISLEALAVAGSGAPFAEMAETLGAARIAPFGSLQSPPLGAFHGARPRIADFVRWIVDET